MPLPLPPDTGDSGDPEGTLTLATPEATILAWVGIPPDACGVKAGGWTTIKSSTGVGALLD